MATQYEHWRLQSKFVYTHNRGAIAGHSTVSAVIALLRIGLSAVAYCAGCGGDAGKSDKSVNE
jgi:hypothetical protein